MSGPEPGVGESGEASGRTGSTYAAKALVSRFIAANQLLSGHRSARSDSPNEMYKKPSSLAA